MNWLRAGLGVFIFITLCLGLVVLVLFPNNPLLWGGAWIASLVLIGVSIALNWQRVKSFLLERRTRYGANLALSALLIFGILAFVNYLSMNYRHQSDVSLSGRNTLAPQTRDVLAKLEHPTMIYFFGRQATNQEAEQFDAAKRLLEMYDYESKNLSYEIIDPNLYPARTKAFGVTSLNTFVIVVEDGLNKRVKVEGASEEKLTNGIVRALKKSEQKIYFVQGHGERRFANPRDAASLTFARDLILREGFLIEELHLALQEKIPNDAALLAIIGPREEFTDRELQMLEHYFATGGRALIAFDLDVEERSLSRGGQQLARILKKYGVQPNTKLMIDTSSKNVHQEAQVIPGLASKSLHRIVRDFPRTQLQGAAVVNFYFPLSTYLEAVEPEKKGYKATPLVNTVQSAWAENSWQEIISGKVQHNEGRDKKGVFNLAYAIESMANKEGLRMVVTATSVFAVNAWIHKVKNRDLLLNSINWLVNQEDFISIRPVSLQDTELRLDQFWMRFVFMILVIALPVSILGTGLWIWTQRRNL